MDWWASPEDAQAHFKAELFRDWGFAAARAMVDIWQEDAGARFVEEGSRKHDRAVEPRVPDGHRP